MGAWTVPPEGVNALLWLFQSLQQAALAVVGWLGGVDDQGQALWPWRQRLATEALFTDPSHARAVVLCLATALGVALAAALAWRWRRGRWPVLALAVLALGWAPWPPAHLLWAPAVPTSFHRSPAAFAAHSLERGRALYQRHCASCHGADGRGNSAEAARLPMWPPDLTGGLLWRRLEGELYWRIRHGLQDRAGQPTMPGFHDRLSADDTWAVLDHLQAQAAGRTLQASGAWSWPVPLPRMAWTCRGGQTRDSRAIAPQRVRLVFLGPGEAVPVDDPRLLTVVAGAAPSQDPECRLDDPVALRALAQVLGVAVPDLPGHQLLVDRQGWLRARSRPADGAWRASDLVCTTSPPGAAGPATSTPADGLEALIRRMDADPVRSLRGGYPH